MHWYKILAFCVALLAGAHAGTRVELTSSSEVAMPGDVVEFKCLSYDFQPGQFLRWQKRVLEVEEAINIATNAFPEPLFNDGRFTAWTNTSKEPLEFYLKINGVTAGDGGSYSCSVPTTDNSIESSVSLTVLREITSFEFTYTNGSETHNIVDGQKIKFKNDSPLTLTCSAGNANPKPEVNFVIGGKVLTGDEVREVSDEHYKVIDKNVGTNEHWFTVTKTLETRITYHDADKTIACIAGLPQAPEKGAFSTSFTVRMEGMPPVIDCASEWTAWEDADDEIILCNITAKPAIHNATVTYYRSMQSDSEYLEQVTAGSDGRYSLTIAPDGSYVIFRIRKVFSQDFREFNFTVVNNAGTTHKVIKFIRDPSQPVFASSAPITTASFTLCLLIAFIQFLSHL